MAPPPPYMVNPPPPSYAVHTSFSGPISYSGPPSSYDPPSADYYRPPPAVVDHPTSTVAASYDATAPLFPADDPPPSPESITICKT